MQGGHYILTGVPGTELDAKTAAIIRDVQPAGFILFGRNIKSPGQLRKLIDDLRGEVRHEPIITIDQEGGRVSRLKECGSEPPSAKQLREKGEIALIERHGKLTGQILRLFGFNLDLCPVLDVSYAGDENNSLKNRTWGLDPATVITNAGAFNRALRSEGVLSCGKHFPGYSYAEVDPHHELPIVPRSRAQLETTEWPAFRALLPEIDSMMIGHAYYPQLDDSGLPASLSPRIITDLLVKDWGYEGVVISDDLDMGAIVGHYGLEDAVTKAVTAGNDLILLCHQLELISAAAKALAAISPERAAQAEARLAGFRKKLSPPLAFSLEAHATLDAQIYQLRVDTLGEAGAALRSADDGKRSPVETF